MIYCLRYSYYRIVQNMSQLNLLSESFIRQPVAPNLANTLLFIQTNRYFPPSSSISLDQHISSPLLQDDDDEISLAQKMEPAQGDTITSTSTIKKKKTGCTCKKTKCLKMYCECFSSGKVCTDDCACFGCSNDDHHHDSLAKAREGVRLKGGSLRNQGKGCNCKKSQCQKKYCECYNAGVACGEACRCEECANGVEHSHGQMRRELMEVSCLGDSMLSFAE